MNDDLQPFLQDFKDVFQEYFDSPHQLDSFLINSFLINFFAAPVLYVNASFGLGKAKDFRKNID